MIIVTLKSFLIEIGKEIYHLFAQFFPYSETELQLIAVFSCLWRNSIEREVDMKFKVSTCLLILLVSLFGFQACNSSSGGRSSTSVSSSDSSSSDSDTTDSNTNSSALPSDPADVATAIDLTAYPDFIDTIAFLYSGDDPIQTGVSDDTIVTERAAVIRGQVLDRDNEPLSGVTITIKDHSEYGQTLSRENGWFDMVVNGGGVLFINY